MEENLHGGTILLYSKVWDLSFWTLLRSHCGFHLYTWKYQGRIQETEFIAIELIVDNSFKGFQQTQPVCNSEIILKYGKYALEPIKINEMFSFLIISHLYSVFKGLLIFIVCAKETCSLRTGLYQSKFISSKWSNYR